MMLPPNELRINNWYFLDNPMSAEPPLPYQFETWTSATDFMAYGSPIPLSHEILEKAGFNNDWEERWSNDDIEIIKSSNGDGYALLNGEECTHWDASIRHLHQLQNLYFALTGEELNISL